MLFSLNPIRTKVVPFIHSIPESRVRWKPICEGRGNGFGRCKVKVTVADAASSRYRGRISMEVIRELLSVSDLERIT